MTEKELEHIFIQYKRLLDAWKQGYAPRWLIDDKLIELYNLSGFTDALDFVLAFRTWEVEQSIKKYEQLKLF